MRGILADVNVRGPVEYLTRLMRAEPWTEFWNQLGLSLQHFEQVGLGDQSTDLEIWNCCQANGLIFITNNRNAHSPDSLEIAIRDHNAPDSLPVLTIANLDKLRASREYADRVVDRIYDYLTRIEELRGVGRLYIP